MKRIKIAEFKSHLSENLREVQRGGEVVILDRETPIARVVPFQKPSSKIIIRPAQIKGGWNKLHFLPIDIGIDVVKLLREDRNRE